MTSREWTRKDFTFGKILGSGQFGNVYMATHNLLDQNFAIKILPKEKFESKKLYIRLKRQIEIHSRLKHPNICRLYRYFTDEKMVYIVMEYCKNGTLAQPIKNNSQKMSNKKIASIVYQIAKAIEFLSKRNILHRDIKLQNLLLDENYNIKLSDFGCSMSSKQQRKTFLGTVEYICPEMVKSEPYGTEADVYCLGIVLYELFYFKSPFHASNKDNMFKNIKEGSVKFNEKTRVIPNDAKELITLLLKGKNERPKIEEVLKHPFVEKYHFGKDQISEQEFTKQFNLKVQKCKIFDATFSHQIQEKLQQNYKNDSFKEVSAKKYSSKKKNTQENNYQNYRRKNSYRLKADEDNLSQEVNDRNQNRFNEDNFKNPSQTQSHRKVEGQKNGNAEEKHVGEKSANNSDASFIYVSHGKNDDNSENDKIEYPSLECNEDDSTKREIQSLQSEWRNSAKDIEISALKKIEECQNENSGEDYLGNSSK